MIRDHSRRGQRSAFTLVELMVVLLIIAILVSLIGSVVMKAMGKIPEVQTRTEISEMSVALQAFMSDYNLAEPPPSTLVLNEASPLSTPSAAFLQQVFGKNLGPTDWNGDGYIAGIWTLKGEKCLTFLLGGIPNSAAMVPPMYRPLPNSVAVPALSPPSPLGFSTNTMNPGQPGGKRKGPYFTFVTSRLWPQTVIPPLWDGFFLYLDPWQTKSGPLYSTLGGSPYAFFSSTGINNLYAGTCTFDTSGPYMIGAGQYTNPNTYQIISAGKDGYYGGGLWSPSGGAQGYGADDQANFSSTLLGSGQN
jgi:prepilin-type N-terminal cleavage/methylation domain-containing protein